MGNPDLQAPLRGEHSTCEPGRRFIQERRRLRIGQRSPQVPLGLGAAPGPEASCPGGSQGPDSAAWDGQLSLPWSAASAWAQVRKSSQPLITVDLGSPAAEQPGGARGPLHGLTWATGMGFGGEHTTFKSQSLLSLGSVPRAPQLILLTLRFLFAKCVLDTCLPGCPKDKTRRRSLLHPEPSSLDTVLLSLVPFPGPSRQAGACLPPLLTRRPRLCQVGSTPQVHGYGQEGHGTHSQASCCAAWAFPALRPSFLQRQNACREGTLILTERMQSFPDKR